MGASAVADPPLRARTPVRVAAFLRRLHDVRGWDEHFDRVVIEELGALIADARRQTSADRILEHLRSIGQRPTTQPEIALAIGIPRETVCRWLVVLQRQGRVRADRRGRGRTIYRVAVRSAPGRA